MTEVEVKKSITPILYAQARPLSMSDLKQIFNNYINIDSKGLSPSESRKNEAAYKQTIGNIVSHQGTTPKVDYPYGYQIKKTFNRTESAMFYLQCGFYSRKNISQENLSAIERENIRFYAMASENNYSFSCNHKELVANIVKYECERVSTKVSIPNDINTNNASERIFDLINDYPKMTECLPFHILSVNDLGEPIAIYVEKCENDNIDLSRLSEGAKLFLRSRDLTHEYTKNKNYIYFVSNTKIITINALELKGEIESEIR